MRSAQAASPPHWASSGVSTGSSAVEALVAAVAATRDLFGPPPRFRRWRQIAGLAMLAGIVGVGIQPPPLGLLQPIWSEPEARQKFIHDLGPHSAPLGLMGGLLLLAAASARCFTLIFIRTIAGAPDQPDACFQLQFRKHLRAGLAHFVWSSAWTLPLYALLFWAEWQITRDGYQRLMAAPNSQLLAIGLGTFGKFLLVLVPWTILTLPAMVTMYELTPAAMVAAECGPWRAFGCVAAVIRIRPGAYAGYLGLRLLFQAIGTGLAFVAAIPSLLVTSVVGVPVLALGFGLTRAVGGPSSPAGAAISATVVLFCLALLYCLLCFLLAPVSATLYTFAIGFLGFQRSSGAGAGREGDPGASRS